jgi:hypothetical protein
MRMDLPFIVHKFKMEVRNMTDKELHSELVGQWKATRDFDEDEYSIMIEELDRRISLAQKRALGEG